MSDEGSGGVRGLEAWAADAIVRAAQLIKRAGTGDVSAEEFAGSVAELSQLRGLLGHDPALLGKAGLTLGVLLTMRHVHGGGAAEDRERALRLLAEARDAPTATEEERGYAAMFLLMVQVPSTPGAAGGAAPGFWSVIDTALSGDPGLPPVDAAAAIEAMAADAERLPLPPEVLEQLRMTRDVLGNAARTDFSDLPGLLDMLPADFPFTQQLRQFVDLADGMADGIPDTTGPESKPTAAPKDTDGASETFAGASLAALFGITEALRSGDPEDISRALARLSAAQERLPDGHDHVRDIENLMGLVLQTGQPLGGSHLDAAVARDQTKLLGDYYEQMSASDPRARDMLVGLRAMSLAARVPAAESADPEELAGLVRELEALEQSTPADHAFRAQVLLALGSALNSLGALTRDTAVHLRGIALQEEGMTALRDASLGLPEGMFESLGLGLRTARAVLGGEPGPLPEYTPAPPDATAETVFMSALTATMRHSVSRDPADLDAAIDALTRVRDHVRQGFSPQMAASSLWQLAENHRLRWARTKNPADRDASSEAALEALRALAGDVVLQSGPEHGLLAARSGAERGVQAAIWAASQGRVEEAVAALELGRALVLQAAATSRTVPDLLEASGHDDLARDWRAAGERGGEHPDALPRELPSSLRRRALKALGHRDPDGTLFRTPTVDELKAGVAEGDADALVYLLAGEGSTPGMGIVVGPDIGTGVRALPLLSAENSVPLERYVDAAARLQENPNDPASTRSWEEALSGLCDWATGAVVAPVLTGVAERLAANENRRKDRPGPPRLVLVPCGRLGIVPWHAARLPEQAPYEYACQAMVISYAASGRQFLDAVRRARRDPAAAPVLVADPSMSLRHTDLEVTALLRAFYPRARLYGELYDPPVEPAGPGTPDDILDVLGGSPSLLHVASHGSAGTSPTESALQLARPDGSAEPPPEQGGPGARPDPGMLTVSRLLDGPGHEQGATDGPLVVLSACETDLSRRDHDEALTLTTAFVAGGARDVVGSRWATRDSASAFLMAVFHHYLTVDGLSPVDALRAAQMWMLDPRRENPGSLTGDLLDELNKRPRLNRPSAWAAFIHQGHPGPA